MRDIAYGWPIEQPKTVKERFSQGADMSKGLSGSMPIHSQPERRSRKIEHGQGGYGEDIKNGVTYE